MTRNNNEALLQQACVKWLHIQENMGRLLFYHVPNGGKRGIIEASKFKRLGVRAGVPDLVILRPGGSSLYIELKAGMGKLNDNQNEWRDKLSKFSFNWYCLNDLDEFIELVEWWLD